MLISKNPKWKEANGFYSFVFDPEKLGVGQSSPQPKSLAFMYARLVEILATSKLSVVRLVFDPGEEIFVYHIAIPVLVKHLQAPPCNSGSDDQKPYEHEVEKASAFALGLLAVKVGRIFNFWFLSYVLVNYCQMPFNSCNLGLLVWIYVYIM